MLARRFGEGAAELGSMMVAALALAGCSFPDYTVTETPTDDSEIPAEDADADAVSPFDSSTTDAARDADARDVSIDADAPGVDGDTKSGACEPVKQLFFMLPAPVPLKCASSVVFEVTLPPGTEGMAFARANLSLTHAAFPKISYNWSAKLEVGAADKDQIAFSSGDDLCPGATTGKVIGGYGRVDVTNPHVRLSAVQASTLCSVGAVTLGAATSIDVWVESARPECLGKAIVVQSYLKIVGPASLPWDWPLTAAASPILTAKIETASTDTSLVTIATIEGTAGTNPNTTCGTEAATLTMQTGLDGVTVSTSKLAMPATSGPGHLLLDAFHDAPTLAGVHTVQLLAGRDFATSRVTTGGVGGDALLAIVRKY